MVGVVRVFLLRMITYAHQTDEVTELMQEYGALRIMYIEADIGHTPYFVFEYCNR